MDENNGLNQMPRGAASALSNRTKGIITLVVVALYLSIPVDFIPDAMVGLGQLDDAIVFALGLLAILLKLRKPQA